MKYASYGSRIALASGTLVVALSLAAIPSTAQGEGPPPLPPEAYAACDSKAVGDTCTVTIFGKDVTGTCTTDRDGGRLFCRPSGPPPGPPRP